MKILIVDDDIFNQEVLQMRLESFKFDFEFKILDNGKEALEFVKSSNKIDCIFMDINMPIMDGDRATELIREYEKESEIQRVPIIAVSASIDKKDRERLILCGMDEIIIKPIKQEELEKVINNFLLKQNSFEYDIEKASNNLMISVEMMQGLLSRFINSLDDDLIEMMGIAQREDYEALRALAHKLKGRSANLGIFPMQELFGKIEKSAKEQISLDYEKIIDEISSVHEGLKKF